MVPIITALIPGVLELVKRFFPDDPDKQQEFQMELLKQMNSINTAQLEVNKEEAKHSSIFVAGWRPFIGWICGSALAFNWLLLPLLINISTYIGKPIVLNSLDTNEIIGLVMGILGMGGLRTFEKIKGVARK